MTTALTRTAFSTSRTLEYFSERELVAQTGHTREWWPEMTVKEFIRDIRLKRAAQLLVQKKMNVSEVAYAVGFKDLSHFRKCFRQEFNMSASEYIDKHSAVQE